MHPLLATDLHQRSVLLATARELSLDYLHSLPERPVALAIGEPTLPTLPETGPGSEAALHQFWERFGPVLPRVCDG